MTVMQGLVHVIATHSNKSHHDQQELFTFHLQH